MQCYFSSHWCKFLNQRNHESCARLCQKPSLAGALNRNICWLCVHTPSHGWTSSTSVSTRQQILFLCLSHIFPLSVMKLQGRIYTEQYSLGVHCFLPANALLTTRENEWIIRSLKSPKAVFYFIFIFLTASYFTFHHLCPRNTRNGLRSSQDKVMLPVLFHHWLIKLDTNNSVDFSTFACTKQLCLVLSSFTRVLAGGATQDHAVVNFCSSKWEGDNKC